ncbi:CCA tRNA nucleotidyltransferase [Aquisalibacillus elongatus]|uniref:CCA tRNA nucleotidyltransferase n=1 Tax=Aquisalibacillus elongatus TaxID=485577 RepID=UPI0014748401|nr:CCA tRNA nucleotidyltransferase [Aquisalibacillus elongatus]
MNKPFTQAKPIFENLYSNGFECYFVGGAVRDYLLNQSIGDIDIATNATPEEIQRIFQKTVPVGFEHGTVLVIEDGVSFEVTTYRTEGEYKDYRHPSYVEFVKNIQEDLSRRDFTINAIAMDLMGRIIDPFGGQEDLQNRIIRTVGKAEDRFNEDPLRMLRGIRFVSQLNFSMSHEAIQAIQNQRQLLEKISVERIADEISKLFSKQHIQFALDMMNETGIYKSLPILNDQEHVFMKLLSYDFDSPFEHTGLLVAFLHLLDRRISIQQWIKAYKLSNDIRNKANHLVEVYERYESEGLTNYVLYKADCALKDVMKLIHLLDEPVVDIQSVYERYEHLRIKNRHEMAINGQDLMNWFSNVKRGKWIGDFLEQIEYRIVKEELENDRNEIERLVKQWKAPENN